MSCLRITDLIITDFAKPVQARIHLSPRRRVHKQRQGTIGMATQPFPCRHLWTRLHGCRRACAGMMARGDFGFWRNDARAIGMARNPFHPSSLQRRLESRQQSREDQRMTARFYRHRTAWLSYGCHSRKAGMDSPKHWIPACAGMTAGVDSSLCQTATGIHALSPHTGLPQRLVPDAALPPASMQACP